VLGELAGIGLTAGLLGAALALPLSALLGLHPSPPAVRPDPLPPQSHAA